MGDVALLWLFMSGVLVACAVAVLIGLGAALVVAWLFQRLVVSVVSALGEVVRDGQRRAQVSRRLRSRGRGGQAGGVRGVLGPVTGPAAVGGVEGAAVAGRGRAARGGGCGVAVVSAQPPVRRVDKPGSRRLTYGPDRYDRRPEGHR